MDGGDGRHLLLVGLLALGSADDPLRAVGLDHRDAFAVDRGDEDFACSRLDRICRAGGVEALEVHGGLLHELLGRALGHGRAGDLGDQRDRLVKRPADDRLDQSTLILIAPQAGGQTELGVEWVDRVVSRRAVPHPCDP